MDLKRLSIDRQTAARPARRRSAAPVAWIVRIAIVVAAAGALWLFRGPLMGWLDRFRLPELDVVAVGRRGPAEAAAVSGIAANGHIVARVRAALSADTPGRIVEINVEEGQRVEKGFVVARLYADEYAASLRRAEADLQVATAAVRRAEAEHAAAAAEFERRRAAVDAAKATLDEARADEDLATRNFERTRELVAAGNESPQKLDESKAALDAARARVASSTAQRAATEASRAEGESRIALAAAAIQEARATVTVREAARDLARATLEKTEVRAPFDGIVVLKDAEVGEVVSPNSQAGSNARGSVVTMVDFDSLEAQAEVPETSLAGVHIGAPARIFLDAFPAHAYPGRVDRIWPTADRQKATIEVRVTFDERDDLLRPEMGVRVVFLPDDADVPANGQVAGADSGEAQAVTEVFVVPETAVVRSEGRSIVFVVERDVVSERAVQVGERRGSQVIIESGLVAEERVVREPPPTLDDGDRIRVR